MALRLLQQEYESDDNDNEVRAADGGEAAATRDAAAAAGPSAKKNELIVDSTNFRKSSSTNANDDDDSSEDDDEDSSDDDDDDDESDGGSSSDSSSDARNDKEWRGAAAGGADGAAGLDDSDGELSVLKIVANSKKNSIRAKGELALEDLPPIEDLHISVPEQECEAIGTVCDIVDLLVIIESFPNKPSLDLDTVLFLDAGKTALGQIFDVFGQVTKPYYCIRFNSASHIKEKAVAFGMSVYYAPKTSHTHYVFISELMKTKGSDASWKDDVETPPQFQEYSDDEEERRAKRLSKSNKRPIGAPEGDSAPARAPERPPATRPRPTKFEEFMNRKNLMMTAECNRNVPQRRHHPGGFNPFGRRGGGGGSRSGPSAGEQQASEIRWPPSGAGRATTNNNANNWAWGGNQGQAVGMGAPPFNVPRFMRPPRFLVTRVDWGAPPTGGGAYGTVGGPMMGAPPMPPPSAWTYFPPQPPPPPPNPPGTQ